MIWINNTLRAWTVAALAAALAAVLLALVALATPAQAASRYKTVTKTFANGSVIRIPGAPSFSNGPASPYPSEITVGLSRGRILDANLTLGNLSHTNPNDLDVLLHGPRGQHAFVMSDVGGLDAGASNVTLALDDEATSPMGFHTALASGRYRPTEDDTWDATYPDTFPPPAPTPSETSELSIFDGTNPKGTWKLYVVDAFSGDVGEITGGWALQIKARVRR